MQKESKELFPPRPVLLIDDEETALTSYRILLHAGGVSNVKLSRDGQEALSLLARQTFDTIVLDLRLPGMPGEDVLERIQTEFPGTPVVVITAVDDTETVVRCMKAGAFDFLVKPVDKNRLVTSVLRCLQFKRLEQENISLKQGFLSAHLRNPDAFSAFDTGNETMRSIFRYMEVIADSSEPILITGETGTGKEVVARTMGKLARGGDDFVSVNVAGLDDQLFTDTLFGHTRGAFTDAREARKGLVERAGKGILFLDEIGDLSGPSQVKLLRLIQEHEYYPIGADVPRKSRARIIVSTNKDLARSIETGDFRRDLYYRLCVHHIQIPPLRRRKEDIPLLTDYFIGEAAAALGKKKPTVPRELYTLLSVYHFPGNIRELRSMVVDAVSRHGSRKLSLETFKKAVGKSMNASGAGAGGAGLADGGMGPGVAVSGEDRAGGIFRNVDPLPNLKEARDQLVLEALHRAADNQTIAAQMLGVTRQALNRRLKEMAERDGGKK